MNIKKGNDKETRSKKEIKPDKEIKNRLKSYRAKHNLTQEELAKKLGITRQTVIVMEKGKYNPSLHLAFRIVELFNCRIEDIFTFVDKEEEK